MTAATDHLSNLRTIIVRAIREELGLHERLAVPIADRVLSGLRAYHGGEAIYVPAITRADRIQAIRAAQRQGLGVDEIAAFLSINRATVYRALNTKPRPTEANPDD